METASPKVFVSYSWDNDAHKTWVKEFATSLRQDGIDVSLDQWNLVPGDQLPEFMEREIRENDYVLIICTPRYKERSDKREGGAGYEGDIMTAEILSKGNHRKFIPIIREGELRTAAPSWLLGKYSIDLRSNPINEQNYRDLLETILNCRPKAPQMGEPLYVVSGLPNLIVGSKNASEYSEITILNLIVDEVSSPKNDGTPGSALYRVPFRLSASPSREWAQTFINNWNHPPTYTSMHRPGIARVTGNKIILDGTTLEEVKKYHRDTLVIAVEETNKKMKSYYERKKREEEQKKKEHEEHRKKIEDVSKDINF